MVLVLVTATVGAFVWGLAWFALRCPRLRAAPDAPEHGAAVSVVIPARNEAAHIVEAVRAALAQGPIVRDVCVVDDGSTDATAELVQGCAAEDARVTLLHAPPLPPGWTGKSHALAHAAARASGDWLAFVDADARLRPGAVAAGVAAARAHGATFLSLWPRQCTSTFLEARIQALVIGVSAVGNALQRVRGAPFPAALSAWGIFILVDAAAYRRVGGHAVVADRLLEDTELCHAFRRTGEGAVTFDGHYLLTVRMYDGVRDLWQGWRKNLFPSLGGSLLATLGVAAFTLIVTWGPLLGFLTALAGRGPVAPWTLPLALQFLVAGPLAARLVQVPAWAAASPVGGAGYALLLLDSARAHLGRRGVTWKGRAYAAGDDG